MKTTDVVIGGGDQTAELIPVGHKHEDALREETICDDKRLFLLHSLCSRCKSQLYSHLLTDALAEDHVWVHPLLLVQRNRS